MENLRANLDQVIKYVVSETKRYFPTVGLNEKKILPPEDFQGSYRLLCHLNLGFSSQLEIEAIRRVFWGSEIRLYDRMKKEIIRMIKENFPFKNLESIGSDQGCPNRVGDYFVTLKPPLPTTKKLILEIAQIILE